MHVRHAHGDSGGAETSSRRVRIDNGPCTAYWRRLCVLPAISNAQPAIAPRITSGLLNDYIGGGERCWVAPHTTEEILHIGHVKLVEQIIDEESGFKGSV